MATFEIDELAGSYDGETWTIDDPTYRETILPSLTALFDLERGGEYIPDRATAVVEFVMPLVGGRILTPDPASPADEISGRVYQKLGIDSV